MTFKGLIDRRAAKLEATGRAPKNKARRVAKNELLGGPPSGMVIYHKNRTGKENARTKKRFPVMSTSLGGGAISRKTAKGVSKGEIPVLMVDGPKAVKEKNLGTAVCIGGSRPSAGISRPMCYGRVVQARPKRTRQASTYNEAIRKAMAAHAKKNTGRPLFAKGMPTTGERDRAILRKYGWTPSAPKSKKAAPKKSRAPKSKKAARAA